MPFSLLKVKTCCNILEDFLYCKTVLEYVTMVGNGLAKHSVCGV